MRGINQNHEPSVAKAGKVAVISGVVGGAVSLTAFLYQKHKEGKSVFKEDYLIKNHAELDAYMAN